MGERGRVGEVGEVGKVGEVGEEGGERRRGAAQGCVTCVVVSKPFTASYSTT